MVDVVLFVALVLLFSLVSRRIESTPMTAPMLFVTAGMILGTGGIGLIQRPVGSDAFLMVGEIALVLLLFSDAVMIDLNWPAEIPGYRSYS